MKTIILHGALSDHIPGGKFNCEFLTAREAASALEFNFPGFFKKIEDMYIHIKPGKNQKYSLDEGKLVSWKIGEDELHIIPAAEGAGGGGGGGGNSNAKAILGVALIAVAIIGTGGFAAIGTGSLGTAVFANPIGITGLQMLAVGASLVFQAFAPAPPGPNRQERIDNVIFTGPLNTNKEGDVLPYAAGLRLLAGGVIFNTELNVDHTSTSNTFIEDFPPPPPPEPEYEDCISNGPGSLSCAERHDTWKYGR